jgi:hypothetical protein
VSCRQGSSGRSQSSSGDADGPVGVIGHRHGHRSRSLMGSFGRTEIEVPRARLDGPDGKTTEWKSKTLRAYQRRTLAADALIASTYLAGTNTRRVRRALAALFGGAVGKDTVSRVWRKVKADWEAWNARSLAEEPIVRLILDGTVVRVRLDRKATSISLLVVIGVREDGQKVLLALKNMGGETTEAWRAVLDDLVDRGLHRPAFLIVDGAPGLEKAIAAVWDGVPVQRCTVHKHRNLLAHAPERLHDEITADYTDMIYAATPSSQPTTQRGKLQSITIQFCGLRAPLAHLQDGASSTYRPVIWLFAALRCTSKFFFAQVGANGTLVGTEPPILITREVGDEAMRTSGLVHNPLGIVRSFCCRAVRSGSVYSGRVV